MRNVCGYVPTRYEMNRLVRNILTRYGADLELISISCTGRVVCLSGLLTKITRPDYRLSDIDAIFRSIAKIPAVRSIYTNLDNWTVSAVKSTGEWLITRKGTTSYQVQPLPLGRLTRWTRGKKSPVSPDKKTDEN